MKTLGVDIGGSGVKGAIVDTRTGKLLSNRIRLKTPMPATPRDVAKTVARLARRLEWKGPVGCCMPGPLRHGTIMAIANLDKSWVGKNASEVFTRSCGVRVTALNDADAAGMAEMRFGAGKGARGVVVVVTLGTGIGSALFVDGRLVPNTEFGQIQIRGKTAEARASARVRKVEDLSWDRWSKRVNEYFLQLENLLWPDLIIVGGGVSRKAGRFIPHISTRARVVPALLRNEAGLIGAALAARR
jgi:polyphosphate glucokinase